MMDEVTFLEEFISIPGFSGQEDAVAEYLVWQMAALGFRVRRDEVGNVVGTLGDVRAERAIVLMGHIDTVSGLVPVRREGGRLYGRGAVDAKGPLAAFVLAAARVAPQLNGVPFDHAHDVPFDHAHDVPFDHAHDVPFDHAHGARLVVIGAVEEEAHSRGARHLTRTMLPPDCVIIGEPGGWAGVTLGYKGVLSVDYRLARPTSHSASGQPTPAEEAVAFWNRLRPMLRRSMGAVRFVAFQHAERNGCKANGYPRPDSHRDGIRPPKHLHVTRNGVQEHCDHALSSGQAMAWGICLPGVLLIVTEADL